ncbi:putative ribonuclease H-like domain-containing protein [Tanacetum coccineum]
MGTVRFGNDHFAAITGYGDYVKGNLTICHVYYVEGLGHNLFSVGHFCDRDLEVAFPCEQGKSKKATFPPKLVPSTESKLEFIHVDLCGLMRVESINGKRYILVIVDDYSRYTWLFFLRTIDEAPDVIINFINQIQRNMRTQVLKIRSDNGTEFKKDKLRKLYEKLGIIHHASITRTPQHNTVIKRRNRMASECNNSGTGFNCSNFQDSSKDSNSIPSKEDLDYLYGPMYEEYYATRSPEVSDSFAAITLDKEDTLSFSSIVVEENEALKYSTPGKELVILMYLLVPQDKVEFLLKVGSLGRSTIGYGGSDVGNSLNDWSHFIDTRTVTA